MFVPASAPVTVHEAPGRRAPPGGWRPRIWARDINTRELMALPVTRGAGPAARSAHAAGGSLPEQV